MHFPVGWDPYFKDVMTVADVYRYPTQHYDHHRRQRFAGAAGRSHSPPHDAPGLSDGVCNRA